MNIGTPLLSFDDVSLVPQFSDVKSRDDLSISVNSPFGTLHSPVFIAPMDTVCGELMAITAWVNGVTPVIHRGMPLAARINALRYVIDHTKPLTGYVGVAVGLKEDLGPLFDSGVLPDFLCLDTANGHNLEVARATEALAKATDIPIMTGNVATGEAAKLLILSGARMIRVGIGGGSACLTRVRTGHGIPTLASLLETKEHLERSVLGEYFLIADGGVRNSGDAVKALAAGANAVMIGGYLAGSSACPGETIKVKGKTFKAFRGMASAEAKGFPRYVEGYSGLVPYKGSSEGLLTQFLDGIRSGLSYSGATNLKELHEVARFVQITTNGAIEAKAHAFSG